MPGYFMYCVLPILVGLCEKLFVVGVQLLGYKVVFSYRISLSILHLGYPIDVSVVHHCAVEELCVPLALFEPLYYGFLAPQKFPLSFSGRLIPLGVPNYVNFYNNNITLLK
jgi:hypothetical protein